MASRLVQVARNRRGRPRGESTATDGKMRLVLRSTKVLARVEDFETNSVLSNSLQVWNGQVFGTRRRVLVYEHVFDERQKQALEEARELARRACLVFEVTDLSRQSALKRILRLDS